MNFACGADSLHRLHAQVVPRRPRWITATENFFSYYDASAGPRSDETLRDDLFAGGEIPAIGGGYYAHQALTPGDQVLELGGDNCGPYPFSTYARYELHVGN